MASDPRKYARKNRVIRPGYGDNGKYSNGRQARVQIKVHAPDTLLEWYMDRAAVLGVAHTALLRDVLTLWAELVIEEEQRQGYDLRPDSVSLGEVPDRVAGYKAELVPRGESPSHLDGNVLSLEETLNG